MIFPTGDSEGRQVTELQPTKLAAMEGLFYTEQGAGIVILGQPNVETRTIDNAVEVPWVLSILTYRHWSAEIRGLDAFPEDRWPDAIPLAHPQKELGSRRAGAPAPAWRTSWTRRLGGAHPRAAWLAVAIPRSARARLRR